MYLVNSLSDLILSFNKVYSTKVCFIFIIQKEKHL